MRLLFNEIFFYQLYSFSKHLLFKIISTEGTTFLNFTIALQFKKLFSIKEILNTIPLKRTKNLFKKFSDFLVQKKYQQEFIVHSLSKLSSEKIISGNLLIIFKCLLKIQEKAKVTGMNLVIYNLVTIFKENMDLLLRFDNFFQTETQFLPIIVLPLIKMFIFQSARKKKKITNP